VHVAEEDSARFGILNGNSLLIKNVEVMDSGNYSCSVYNHITEEIKVSGYVARS
jgi:IMP cyclohydrolase